MRLGIHSDRLYHIQENEEDSDFANIELHFSQYISLFIDRSCYPLSNPCNSAAIIFAHSGQSNSQWYWSWIYKLYFTYNNYNDSYHIFCVTCESGHFVFDTRTMCRRGVILTNLIDGEVWGILALEFRWKLLDIPSSMKRRQQPCWMVWCRSQPSNWLNLRKYSQIVLSDYRDCFP